MPRRRNVFEEPSSPEDIGPGSEAPKKQTKQSLELITGTKGAEREKRLRRRTMKVEKPEALEAEVEAGLAKLEEGDRKRRDEALRDEPSYVEHRALADIANARAAFHSSNIDSNRLTSDNAWQVLAELRKTEIQLQEALEEAWKRPETDASLPAAEAERQALLHAQWGVRDVINSVNTRVEELAGHDPQAYEHELANAQSKAYKVYENDIRDAQAFVADMRAHRTTPEAREQVLQTLEQRAGAIESVIEDLERLDVHAAQEPDNLAAHIAATYAFNELRQAIFEIREQVLQDRSISEAMEEAPPTKRMAEIPEETEKVPETIRNLETAPVTERMRGLETPASQVERWKDVIGKLVKLKKDILRGGIHRGAVAEARAVLDANYAGAEERLEILRGLERMDDWVALEKETLAEMMHLIEDIRNELEKLEAKKGVAPSVEEPSVPTKMDEQLEAYLAAKKQELANIRRAQTRLAKEIESAFGKPPEEFVAKGGMGIGNWTKRLFTRLTGGKDAYAAWLELSKKADRIASDIESPLTYRTGEGAAKAAIRRTDIKMERERIRQREAAQEYHEARGRSAPGTEEEFFGGTLEQPEPAFLEQADYAAVRAVQRASLEKTALNAEQRGATNAREVAANLSTNGAMEFASFDPEEYVRQLGNAAEAQKAGNTRKFMKAQQLLRSMQNELRELGIDPDTGAEIRGVGGRVPRNVKQSKPPRSSGVSGGIQV